MIQRKQFEKECEAAIQLKSPGPEADHKWPLITLLDTLNFIATENDAVNGKGQRHNWTVTTSALVGIYRDELSKARAEDQWNNDPDRRDEMPKSKRNKGQES